MRAAVREAVHCVLRMSASKEIPDPQRSRRENTCDIMPGSAVHYSAAMQVGAAESKTNRAEHVALVQT